MILYPKCPYINISISISIFSRSPYRYRYRYISNTSYRYRYISKITILISIFLELPYRYWYRYRYFSELPYRYRYRYRYFQKRPYRYWYRYRYFSKVSIYWQSICHIDISNRASLTSVLSLLGRRTPVLCCAGCRLTPRWPKVCNTTMLRSSQVPVLAGTQS